jgi:hypothetical protein
MQMMDRYTFEGALTICDQEGGYAAPDILIDGDSIPVLIEAIFNTQRKPGAEGIEPPGRFRITLEQTA